MKMPREKRKFLEAEVLLNSYLGQTHMSERNIARVRLLAASLNPAIAALATGMLDVVCAERELKRKKGRQSIAMTPAVCGAICARWGVSSPVELEAEDCDFEDARELGTCEYEMTEEVEKDEDPLPF